MIHTNPKRITIRQAHDLYGLDEQNLRLWIKAKKLVAHKVGRKWYLDTPILERFIGMSNE